MSNPDAELRAARQILALQVDSNVSPGQSDFELRRQMEQTVVALQRWRAVSDQSPPPKKEPSRRGSPTRGYWVLATAVCLSMVVACVSWVVLHEPFAQVAQAPPEQVPIGEPTTGTLPPGRLPEENSPQEPPITPPWPGLGGGGPPKPDQAPGDGLGFGGSEPNFPDLENLLEKDLEKLLENLRAEAPYGSSIGSSLPDPKPPPSKGGSAPVRSFIGDLKGLAEFLDFDLQIPQEIGADWTLTMANAQAKSRAHLAYEHRTNDRRIDLIVWYEELPDEAPQKVEGAEDRTLFVLRRNGLALVIEGIQDGDDLEQVIEAITPTLP